MADADAYSPEGPPEELFQACYRELLPEFLAFPSDKIAPVNLDVTTVVTTILGVHPKFVALTERFRVEEPRIDIERLKRLDDYAMALRHAQTLYVTAIRPPDNLEALVEDGKKLRETLIADSTGLVHRKLIDAKRLDRLRRPVGNHNIASDLLLLAEVFRTSWSDIEGKCATHRAELGRADDLSARILNAIGSRKHRAVLVAQATDIRARAFSVVLRHYHEARRVVTFLRWHEKDADEIAPSLFAGRNGGRRRAKDEVDGAAVTAGASPVTVPAETPAVQTEAAGPPSNSEPFLN